MSEIEDDHTGLDSADTFRPSNVVEETPRLLDAIGEWLDAINQGVLPESTESGKAVRLARLIIGLWPDCPYVTSAVERHETLLGLREAVEAASVNTSAGAEPGAAVVSIFKPKS